MKYKIKPDKQLYSFLKDIQYSVSRIKNKTITMAWDWQQFSFSYKERFGKWPKQKETTGRALKQDIYHEVKEWNDGFNSLICDVAIKEALDKFKEQKREILKGNESIPTYKRNGAFSIRASQIKNITKLKKNLYSVQFSILSMKKAKNLNIGTQVEAKLLSGGSANTIMDRILDGTYELADSKIEFNENKKQFFLLVSYKFEKQEVYTDPNRIMGVDLGINVPATISINSIPYSTKFVGNKQEILKFEKQMKDRRKQLQKSRKWAGDGSVGHGTKTRIKPITKLKNKIANYKDTKNHSWSKYIVDHAVKNGVGLIQLEDLTDISANNKFLKRWTYYDLQQKIEYKANEFGIEVVKVQPNHTSARCYHCGAIHRSKDKHIWRKQTDTFTCMNCNYSDNADANAAKNLSIMDISKIITAEKEEWFHKFDDTFISK